MIHADIAPGGAGIALNISAATPEEITRAIRVRGVQRARGGSLGAPLYPDTADDLRAAGVRLSARIVSYLQNAARVRAYVERQKTQPARPEPMFPMPLKPEYQPYDHQVRAYNIALALMLYLHGWEEDGARTFLPRGAAAMLLDMGTGKSLITVAAAGRLYLDGRIWRMLVVAPASVCGVWEAEFARASAFPYRLELLLGEARKRRCALARLQRDDGALQVAVINYESAWRLLDELRAFAPDLIVCDESQRIKSRSAKQSKAMHDLGAGARYRMILTGTPIQKDPRDIWSQFRFLEPGAFPTNFFAFQARYAQMGGFQGKQYLRPVNSDELSRKIHALAYRVRKEDCLDLPEKVFEDRPAPLEEEAERLYQRLRKEAVAELMGGGEISAPHVLTKLLRLQQLAGGWVADDSGRLRQVSRAKLDAARDIMETLCLDEGRKLVILSRFRAELNALEEAAQEMGLTYVRIDGSVKPQDRTALVEHFQTDGDCPLFLGILDACAEGLTLTAAQTILYYSLTFNYAKYDQSLARIHRIGQTGSCLYIHLVAPGTIDEVILQALKNKEDLARSVVDDWRRLLGETEKETHDV